jgi:hypothetical protein
LLEEGHRASIAWILKHKATVVLAQGDLDDAAHALHQALAYARESGEREGVARTLADLACLTMRQGHAEAATLYAECIALWRELNDQPNITGAAEHLALTLGASGDPEAAAFLWGAAEASRDQIGIPMPPVRRPGYENAVAAARRNLAPHAFEVAWARGRDEEIGKAIMVVCGAPKS